MDVTLALALTAFAGAATALGGLAAVHWWVRSDTELAAALGFAAGAMLLVSVVEIIPKGASGLAGGLGAQSAWVVTLALVAAGAAVTGLLAHRLARHGVAPERDESDVRRQRLVRSGAVVACAVAAHNLPEGLATFVTTLDDPQAGVAVAVAIAVHNVPEGVAVAAPFFGAGLGRAKAFGAAALSGLAEPVGALLGYLLLVALLPPAAFAVVFGAVAGIMLHIALTELLPMARRLSTMATASASFVAGAGTMGASLVLLNL
ncbi:ZIP family metal transporter [Nocardioides sp. AE5]|uniref:ZIP family metal transporter n=1 Tax=Nocardioides sp. AE5 TaxID=2962573 RepID=UPI0028821B04|nr:ZIP family metal transporter [Nocardioides sp. AE5]MDT0203516.1 ZIP family metal transporter [Nocardioides sp. AE5]